jgi:hypothetical protein
MNLCMFAEIRYETALFIAPVVFFLLIFRLAKLEYLRPYRIIYSLTPLFLLPRMWQSIFRGNVPEQDPGAITFSVGNFITNARNYFQPMLTPFDNRTTHAAFVIAVGVIGCVLAVRWMVIRLRQHEHHTPEFRFAAMASGWMALQLVIVFTYVWGRPEHAASARLIITIDTFFSFLAAWAVTAVLGRFKTVVPTVVAACLFAMAVPVAAQNRLIKELTITREAAETWRFFESLHEKRILIVAERPGLFTVMNYGAVDFEEARRDPGLLAALPRRLFYDIYLVQQIDLTTKKPMPQYEIWPERATQTMLEFQNDGNATVRISRLAR